MILVIDQSQWHLKGESLISYIINYMFKKSVLAM